MFECLMPLITYSLKSTSTTIKRIGFETATFWTFVNQGSILYLSLGHFTKDERSVQFMIQNLFTDMGSYKTSEKA
jgi:hypothetical protein